MLAVPTLTPEEQNSLNQKFLNACNSHNNTETDNAKITKLLGDGAQITAIDEQGNNALHIACRSSRDLLISTLLTAGCDPNQPNNNGTLPFGMIRKMISEHLGNYPLQVRKAMNLILSAEDSFTPHGQKNSFESKYEIYTPLQLAFIYGCKEAIKAQLDKRTNIDNVRVAECSLLVYILNEKIRKRSNDSLFSKDEVLEIASWLIDQLNYVNSVNGNTQNPLHLAAILDSDAVCKKLIDKDPDLMKAVDKDGRIPIWYAAFNGNTSTVQYMLEHGSAPIDDVKFTQFLLATKIDTNLKDEIIVMMNEARQRQTNTN